MLFVKKTMWMDERDRRWRASAAVATPNNLFINNSWSERSDVVTGSYVTQNAIYVAFSYDLPTWRRTHLSMGATSMKLLYDIRSLNNLVKRTFNITYGKITCAYRSYVHFKNYRAHCTYIARAMPGWGEHPWRRWTTEPPQFYCLHVRNYSSKDDKSTSNDMLRKLV